MLYIAIRNENISGVYYVGSRGNTTNILTEIRPDRPTVSSVA
jgi:hypothetical protein